MCLVMPNIVSLCIYLYFSVCVCLIGECVHYGLLGLIHNPIKVTNLGPNFQKILGKS